jgi:hypothetical protein
MLRQQAEEKRALTLTRFNLFNGIEVYIKQAIQGLFTAGTSDRKEKVGGKRGLTPRFVSLQTGWYVPITLQA